MPTAMHAPPAKGLRRRSLAFVLLTLAVGGCKKPAVSTTPRSGKPSYDVGAIDLTAFPADPAVFGRVLLMPFGEAAARLASLKFTARSTFVFSRGTEEYEQNDVSVVVQDSQSNFHVVLDTPENETEVYLIGETLYVRQDRGYLRSKPRRDLEPEFWTEVAFASMREALSLFSPKLRLAEPRPEVVAGRNATRYSLSLATKPEEATPVPTALPRPILPVAPPSRWRELARPLDLQGALWIDATTGVMMRLQLEGQLEIADRQVRPTQLQVRFDAGITEVGKVAAVKAPDSIPEFRRVDRPKNLLGFFSEYLEPDTDKPAKSGKADKGAKAR
ncbi:MAG: hypothetical protein HY903_08255 [Deltaproteobacteria bacterium]|nr:hypothetical protein [Deltaproteobacteria bacterium]